MTDFCNITYMIHDSRPIFCMEFNGAIYSAQFRHGNPAAPFFCVLHHYARAHIGLYARLNNKVLKYFNNDYNVLRILVRSRMP